MDWYISSAKIKRKAFALASYFMSDLGGDYDLIKNVVNAGVQVQVPNRENFAGYESLKLKPHSTKANLQRFICENLSNVKISVHLALVEMSLML